MSFSIDNDIISLNFYFHNAENKNIIFIIEISKNKQVFELKNKMKKKLRLINHNDFIFFFTVLKEINQ